MRFCRNWIAVPSMALCLGASLSGQSADSEQTLIQRAEELRTEGITQAPRTVWSVTYRPSGDFLNLLRNAHLSVSAECIDYSYRLNFDQTEVETIYKFRIEEAFHGPASTNPGLTRKEMDRLGIGNLGSVGRDELLVLQRGGRLTVDGVFFEQVEESFRAFELGKSYVLFLKRPRIRPRLSQERVEYYGGPESPFYIAASGPHGCVEFDNETGSVRSLGELNGLLEESFASNGALFVQFLRERAQSMGKAR